MAKKKARKVKKLRGRRPAVVSVPKKKLAKAIKLAHKLDAILGALLDG